MWKKIKKRLLKLTPKRRQLQGTTLHKILGDKVLQQQLWRWDKAGVSLGLALGIFWALVPMPLQMVPAGLCAYHLKCNLPISLAAVWISNPLTMAPILYGQLQTGRLLLPENAPLGQTFTLGWAIWTLILPATAYSLCKLLWKTKKKVEKEGNPPHSPL